jgi:hypothetical protein
VQVAAATVAVQGATPGKGGKAVCNVTGPNAKGANCG